MALHVAAGRGGLCHPEDRVVAVPAHVFTLARPADPGPVRGSVAILVGHLMTSGAADDVGIPHRLVDPVHVPQVHTALLHAEQSQHVILVQGLQR